MAAKTSWHRYGTKLRHCHPIMYKDVKIRVISRPFPIKKTVLPADLQQQAAVDVSFYRAMLCIRGTSHGPVSVRLSVRPSVRPSVRHKSVFY